MRFEAEALEFPWVEELPKREKSRLAKAWEQLKVFSDATKQAGSLVPVAFAASILGISNQRIHQLLDQGTLEEVRIDSHPFVTERSILAWAKTERKAGRPPKVPETAGQMWKASMTAARSMTGKK